MENNNQQPQATAQWQYCFILEWCRERDQMQECKLVMAPGSLYVNVYKSHRCYFKAFIIKALLPPTRVFARAPAVGIRQANTIRVGCFLLPCSHVTLSNLSRYYLVIKSRAGTRKLRLTGALFTACSNGPV